MLTNARVAAIAFATFILARASIEVVRIASAAQSDPPLAWSYLINTLSVIALITGLALLLRWWGDTETVKRHTTIVPQLRQEDRLVVVGKDKALVTALRRVLPDAPEDFWRAGSASFLFSVVANSGGLHFWFGGKEPRLAGVIPAVCIGSVTLGDGLRRGRNHPTVEVEALTSDGPVSLPMIVSEKSPRTFLPVKFERAQEIARELHRLLSSARSGTTLTGRSRDDPRSAE